MPGTSPSRFLRQAIATIEAEGTVNPSRAQLRAATGLPKQPAAHRGGRTRTTEAAEVLDPDRMAGEIFELKKELLAHKTERKLMKTKVRQLEHECLVANKAAAAANTKAAAGTANSGDSAGAAITAPGSAAGDYKRIVRQLRTELQQERNAYTKLRQSLKSTQIGELELEAQIYHNEVLRLQEVLRSGTGDDTVCGVSSATIRRVSDECQALRTENSELKADLQEALAAAYKLREDLSGPLSGGGDSGRFGKMTRDELVAELLGKEQAMTLLLAESKTASEKLAVREKDITSTLSERGFRSAEEVLDLRSRNESLEAEVSTLRSERDAYMARELDGFGGSGIAAAVRSAGSDASTVAVQTSPNRFPPAHPAETLNSISTTGQTSLVSRQSRSQASSISDQHQAISSVRRTLSPTPSSLSTALESVPTVPDAEGLSACSEIGSTYTAGSKSAAKVQHQMQAAAARRRKVWFAEHKEEANAAITLIQSILRGHLARERLSREIEPSGRLGCRNAEKYNAVGLDQERKQTVVRTMRSPTQYCASSSQLQERQQQRDGPTTIRTVVPPRSQSTSPPSAGVGAYPNHRHSPAATTTTSRTPPIRSVSDHFGGARGISSPEESDSAGNALFRARSLQQNSPVGRGKSDSRRAGAQWATSAYNASAASARSIILEPESEPDATSVTEDIPEDVCSCVMPSCANRRRRLARVRSCDRCHRKWSLDLLRSYFCLVTFPPPHNTIGTVRA